MAHTFTVPQVQVVPPFLPETTGQAFRLFRHYAVTYRGTNVYVMSDGTVLTDYPVELSTGPPPVYSTVGTPLPWNPQQSQLDHANAATGGEQPPVKGSGYTPSSGAQPGSFPFIHVDDPLATPEVFEQSTSPYCVSWFRGACGPYTISGAMYTILLAAGFGSFLT